MTAEESFLTPERIRQNYAAWLKIWEPSGRLGRKKQNAARKPKQRVADKTYRRVMLDCGCLLLSPNRWGGRK
jgi:hypothetical protein